MPKPATLTFDQLGRLSSNAWVDALKSVHYYPAWPVVTACRGMFRRRIRHPSGAQAMLLEGQPGVGKTFLGESIARIVGAAPVIFQFHAWADASDLFVGVNVQAAVAGKAKQVAQPGVLAQVATATTGQSRYTPFKPGEPESPGGQNVVLILDEIDKAPERVEALLLDYLQSGRVPIAPGKHLYTDLRRVAVFVTSNDMRPLTEAFLRRVRRVQVPALPPIERDTVVTSLSGLSDRFVIAVDRLIFPAAAAADGTLLSVQEAANCAVEIADLDSHADPRSGDPAAEAAENRARDLANVLAGWVYRGVPSPSALVALTAGVQAAIEGIDPYGRVATPKPNSGHTRTYRVGMESDAF